MGPTHTPPPQTTSPGGIDGGGGRGSKQSPSKKIRLMISYGGHILPRPDNKTLFYAGGETRIISAARTTAISLSLLHTHISKSLFNNNNGSSHNFILKYQLPRNDLDSLISISSDEDLHNMIDEYDRLASTGRIRFFVFKRDEDVEQKPGSGGGGGVGGGCVDDNWFIDALKVTGSNLNTNICCGGNGGGGGDEVMSPESIALETNSSFGSNNSSNSPGNNKGGDDFKVVLPSVDSLGSDTSIPSPIFNQQTIVYQDASGLVDSKLTRNLLETESSVSDHSTRSDILTPIQVPGYMISKSSMESPQYPSTPPQYPSPPPHASTHYVYHPNPPSHVTQYYPGSIPVAYTPMYQTYVQPQQGFQYQLNNKPYPIYMMSVGQTQNPYDGSSMHCLTTTPPSTVSSSQTQMGSNSVVVASPMVYEGYKPKPNTTGPEYAKMYGPVSVRTQLVTSPPPMNQQLNQPVSVLSSENTKYISVFEDSMHAQIYKTQPPGTTLSSQLQMLPESFTQLQVENAKH